MTEGVQIIKNKKRSIKRSQNIAVKLLNNIKLEVRKVTGKEEGGDPAEEIYLSYYILGHFNGYMHYTLENYGKIYGIKNMGPEHTVPIIKSITDAVYEQLKNTIN